MSYIIFKNKGVIDTRSIATFGVSSKEKEGAIGYFGTGLKYAIAILLREDCNITIYAGNEALEFGTSREKLRVTEFTFVTMNKNPLGFTTELGKNWELWQAFRELYCNCIDEDGEIYESEELPQPSENETIIAVSGGKFIDVWSMRSEIILSTKPMITSEFANIHNGKSNYLFYRGVRVMKLQKPSLFTYDIQRHLDLTEDRTVKHTFYADYYVKHCLLTLTDPTLINAVVTAQDKYYEHEVDFSGGTPTEEFVNVCRTLARTFDARLNPTARELCKNWIMEALNAEDPIVLNKIEDMRMKKAVGFAKSIGFAVDDYPIVVSEFMGDGVLGRAHNEHIYISKRTLMMGTKMLAGTLIEEFLHLRHHLVDETYQMQNFLFDTIVSLGEQLNGEVL